jgi:predicted O-methyltransferase YrrM
MSEATIATPLSLGEVEAKTRAVGGWLSRPEGRRLWLLARNCAGRGAIVEIGSWKGKSTIWLANGSRAGSKTKIHAIDPHTGSTEHQRDYGKVWTFDEFQRNIKAAGVEDLIVPHVDFSENVVRTFNEPVELIFVDGLHEYEGVKADFEAWFPKVIEGGVMAFHDTTGWSGPRQLVVERVFRSPHFKHIGFSRSITYGTKTAQNSAFDRLKNRLMLCAFLAYACLHRTAWRVKNNYLARRGNCPP